MKTKAINTWRGGWWAVAAAGVLVTSASVAAVDYAEPTPRQSMQHAQQGSASVTIRTLRPATKWRAAAMC